MSSLDTLCAPLGRVLWAVSWQVALLVALVWAASLACRRATAAFRYWLWCLVLVRLCLPFSLTFPRSLTAEVSIPHSAFRIPHWDNPQSAIRNPHWGNLQSAIRNLHWDNLQSAIRNPHWGNLQSAFPIPHWDNPQSAIRNPQSIMPTGRRRYVPHSAFPIPHFLVFSWLLAVMVLGVLVFFQTWRIRRRVRSLSEIRRGDLKALFVSLRARMGIRRPVALLYADSVLADAGPLTLGLFRTAIVLPPRVADGWALEDLAPVLLHELAHVRRHDLLVNFFQMVVQVVYFFHPLVWLANWRIRQERELACDDLAMRQAGGRPELYSRAFLRIIEECRG